MWFGYYLVCFILSGYIVVSKDNKNGPIVRLNQGRLMGTYLKTVGTGKDYCAFQGIPYAEPPVEELRFMAPEPALQWEGMLNADDDTKKCPQRDAIFDQQAHGDEDCLYLNVYTPMKQINKDENLPVMFWIHGGGFASGSGSTDFCGPDYFMEEDVVIVTVNYRLGVLGFLNLENDVASGNMGLKDVVMALTWVRDNIKEFGGDANSVTVFGNNAGGAIASLLVLSPMAKGLFHKAICQSGMYKLPQLFGPNNMKRAFTLAKLLHKEPKDTDALLRVLQKVSAFELIKVTPRTFDSTEMRDTQKNILPFGPSVEAVEDENEAFLTRMPEKIFEEDLYPNPDIPLMVGFASREAIVYLRTLITYPEILNNLNYNFQFSLPMRNLEFKYNSDEYKEAAKSIRMFYFEDGIITNTSVVEFVDCISDEIFYPIDRSVNDLLGAMKAPLFYYRFSYGGGLNYYKNAVMTGTNTTISGACSGDELCYLFKCGRLNDTYKIMHTMPNRDLSVIKRMVRMWTNFAKYANPTPPEDKIVGPINWTPTTAENHEFLDIDLEMKMDSNPRKETVDFWNALYEKYSDLGEVTIKTERSDL